MVSVAEGLRELGVPFSANRNYWKAGTDQDYLFSKGNPQNVLIETVHVFSYRMFRYFDTSAQIVVPDWKAYLPDPSTFKSSVLLDLEDGYAFRPERDAQFSIVLRSHFNGRTENSPNAYPWCLAPSNRILESIPEPPENFADRNNSVLMNFGASHSYGHRTRRLFAERFLATCKQFGGVNLDTDDLSTPPSDEYDRLMWEQTQRRHCRAYYVRLSNHKSIAAFCGDMVPSSPFRPNYLVGGRRAKIRRAIFRAVDGLAFSPPRSVQWDSWRFWEGLSAGCLVFNIDLEHYGVKLPVMPVNGKHYVGLRLGEIEEQVQSVLSNETLMESIAANGKAWVQEHYSPKGLAKQFLEIVNKRTLVS